MRMMIKRFLKFFILFLIATGVLAGMIISCSPRTATALIGPADRFFADLRSGQTERAYYETATQFQQTVTLSTFIEFMEQNPMLSHSEKAAFSYSSVQGSVGLLNGTLTSAAGEVSPIAVQLVLENDEWKVLNLNLNPEPPQPTEGE